VNRKIRKTGDIEYLFEHPDDFRRFVRDRRSRKPEPQICSAKEAVSSFVSDGDYIVYDFSSLTRGPQALIRGRTFRNPERRFGGSGGGNQVASHCWKTIIVLKHEGRRFVPRVDFLTSPGYLDGPGTREKAGLPAGTGPYRVVTSKGLFGLGDDTKRMTLLSILRGLDPEDVVRDMSFRPLMSKEIREIPPPTGEELRLLREEIDPSRFLIRGEPMTASV
jgi:hypothetical protein